MMISGEPGGHQQGQLQWPRLLLRQLHRGGVRVLGEPDAGQTGAQVTGLQGDSLRHAAPPVWGAVPGRGPGGCSAHPALHPLPLSTRLL